MSSSRLIDLPPHEWTTNFQCLIYVDNLFLLNDFTVTIGFFTKVENPLINDIELDKIEMFFETLMAGCVIIDKENFVEDIRPIIKNNFLMTPGRPNDQTIASLIYSKLVYMVGENVDIEFVTLSSKLGNHIRFTIVDESPELSVLLPTKEDWWKNKLNPWWLRNDTATYDIEFADSIYEGDFKWEDIFKSELEEIEKTRNDNKKGFKIISGGKDGN
jgi:hypothetical protein